METRWELFVLLFDYVLKKSVEKFSVTNKTSNGSKVTTVAPASI